MLTFTLIPHACNIHYPPPPPPFGAAILFSHKRADFGSLTIANTMMEEASIALYTYVYHAVTLWDLGHTLQVTVRIYVDLPLQGSRAVDSLHFPCIVQ